MNNATKSNGRGRTKGSYSFTTMTLKDLQAQLGADANVVLSRKWVESIGLKNAGEAKSSILTLKQVVVTSSESTETPLQVSVEE